MMKNARHLAAALLCLALGATGADANSYREKGKPVAVAGSTLRVTPPRDWNKIDLRRGKKAEVWTLDGEQLNDVTFFANILPGEPLMRERSKTREPLPKLLPTTLLVEVPELLEGTYRAARGVGSFTLLGSAPARFAGADGIRFTYEYVDSDELPRKGEARAALVKGALYMATYDAPRLAFYDRGAADFRTLADSASLQ